MSLRAVPYPTARRYTYLVRVRTVTPLWLCKRSHCERCDEHQNCYGAYCECDDFCFELLKCFHIVCS